MLLRQVRALRGPNRWTRKTVLELEVELTSEDVTKALAVEARLHEWFPAGADQISPLNGVGAPALPEEARTARNLERVTYALQNLSGAKIQFHKTLKTRVAGVYKVVIEYREESVGKHAVQAAEAIIKAAQNGEDFDIQGTIQKLHAEDEHIRLGPSTGSIVRAAEQRDIPTRRLTEGSLVQLGWGAKQRKILAAETDRTSSIAETIAQDKELTKQLLRAIGVPVPSGRKAEDAEDAWKAAQELGGPVVVKPQYGNQGRGVAVNLTTESQVKAAFAAAEKEGSSIIVEQYKPGSDHRILVIGNRMIAAARRDPPQVIGDGVRTISALVDMVNQDPRRGDDHATSLSKLRLDEIGLAVLAEQGKTADSIPAVGELVLLRRNANLSTGGSATDVTDRVHPDVAARAIDAARAVGLDIAGIDVVCTDVSRPLEAQDGVIVEVNAAPGLRMHLEPSFGHARPVGEAIVGLMFAPEDSGRVPLVAVTGTNGKTTTTRLVGHLFGCQGKKVGLTTSDGIYIDGRRIDSGDCSGPKSARNVLANPLVEAAALETARGGILREGLGWDRCDVAVVTNIGEGDHLGLNGIETVEELSAIKRVLVENVAPHGYAVLNAADPLTVGMASHCPGKVIFFSRDAADPVVAKHRAQGGRAVVVQGGFIVLCEGQKEERVIAVSDVPLTMSGRIHFQVENALAAAAAGWGAGIPLEAMRAGLATFVSQPKLVPARFNVLGYAGATIIVDYAHNVDACKAIIDAVSSLPHRRRHIVFSAAGDRRDIDIERQAELLGDAFDVIVLYEDMCNRGRKDGECLSLMRRGVNKGSRVDTVRETKGELRAIEMALAGLEPGDIVVVQADQIEVALAFIERTIAEHTPTPRKSVPAMRPQAAE
ncbi:MAG: cyanophycin synthetase [Myxococcota bacterium]